MENARVEDVHRQQVAALTHARNVAVAQVEALMDERDALRDLVGELLSQRELLYTCQKSITDSLESPGTSHQSNSYILIIPCFVNRGRSRSTTVSPERVLVSNTMLKHRIQELERRNRQLDGRNVLNQVRTAPTIQCI